MRSPTIRCSSMPRPSGRTSSWPMPTAISSAADHGLAIFHGLWAMGPPRHGALPVHQGDPGRQADQRLQSRKSHPRLHLCRGHRRRGHPRFRPDRPTGSEMGSDAARSRDIKRPIPDLQHRQQRAGGARIISQRSRKRSAGKRRSAISRCSRATYPIPLPTYPPRCGRRLQARNTGAGRRAKFRCVVPRLLSRMRGATAALPLASHSGIARHKVRPQDFSPAGGSQSNVCKAVPAAITPGPSLRSSSRTGAIGKTYRPLRQ